METKRKTSTSQNNSPFRQFPTFNYCLPARFPRLLCCGRVHVRLLSVPDCHLAAPAAAGSIMATLLSCSTHRLLIRMDGHMKLNQCVNFLPDLSPYRSVCNTSVHARRRKFTPTTLTKNGRKRGNLVPPCWIHHARRRWRVQPGVRQNLKIFQLSSAVCMHGNFWT